MLNGLYFKYGTVRTFDLFSRKTVKSGQKNTVRLEQSDRERDKNSNGKR